MQHNNYDKNHLLILKYLKIVCHNKMFQNTGNLWIYRLYFDVNIK
jgi:hypothetical protein